MTTPTDISFTDMRAAVQAFANTASSLHDKDPVKLGHLRGSAMAVARQLVAGLQDKDAAACPPYLGKLELEVIEVMNKITARVVVGLCGSQGIGKSTLLNALVNDQGSVGPFFMPSPARLGAKAITTGILCFAYHPNPGYCKLPATVPVSVVARTVARMDACDETLTAFVPLDPARFVADAQAVVLTNPGSNFLFVGPFPGFAESNGLGKDIVLCDLPGWADTDSNTDQLAAIKDAFSTVDVMILCAARCSGVDPRYLTKLAQGRAPGDIPVITGAYHVDDVTALQHDYEALEVLIKHVHDSLESGHCFPDDMDAWKKATIYHHLANDTQVLGYSDRSRPTSAKIASVCDGWRMAVTHNQLRLLTRRFQAALAFAAAEPTVRGGTPPLATGMQAQSRVVAACHRLFRKTFAQANADLTLSASDLCARWTEAMREVMLPDLRSTVARCAAEYLCSVFPSLDLATTDQGRNRVLDHLAALSFADWMIDREPDAICAPLLTFPATVEKLLFNELVQVVAWRDGARALSEECPNEILSGMACGFFAATSKAVSALVTCTVACTENIITQWLPRQQRRLVPSLWGIVSEMFLCLVSCSSCFLWYRAPGDHPTVDHRFLSDFDTLQCLAWPGTLDERTVTPLMPRAPCEVNPCRLDAATVTMNCIRVMVRLGDDQTGVVVYPGASRTLDQYAKDVATTGSASEPVWHLIQELQESGISSYTTRAWIHSNPNRLHLLLFASNSSNEAVMTAQLAALQSGIPGNPKWTPKYAPIVVQVRSQFLEQRVSVAQLIEASQRLSAHLKFARNFLVLGNCFSLHRLHMRALMADEVSLIAAQRRISTTAFFAEMTEFLSLHNDACCVPVAKLVHSFREDTIALFLTPNTPGFAAARRCISLLHQLGQRVKTESTHSNITVYHLQALRAGLSQSLALTKDVKTSVPDAHRAFFMAVVNELSIAINFMRLGAAYPMPDYKLMVTRTLGTNASVLQTDVPQIAPACVLFDVTNSDATPYMMLTAVTAPQSSNWTQFYEKAGQGLQQYLSVLRNRSRMMLGNATLSTTTIDEDEILAEIPTKVRKFK